MAVIGVQRRRLWESPFVMPSLSSIGLFLRSCTATVSTGDHAGRRTCNCDSGCHRRTSAWAVAVAARNWKRPDARGDCVDTRSLMHCRKSCRCRNCSRRNCNPNRRITLTAIQLRILDRWHEEVPAPTTCALAAAAPARTRARTKSSPCGGYGVTTIPAFPRFTEMARESYALA